MATETTDEDKNKFTNGGSFGANLNSAGDDETTLFIGDVEQGDIRCYGWGDGKQSGLILRLLFLGSTLQVRESKTRHMELGVFLSEVVVGF